MRTTCSVDNEDELPARIPGILGVLPVGFGQVGEPWDVLELGVVDAVGGSLAGDEDGKLLAARLMDLRTKGVVIETLKLADTGETWAMVQMKQTGSRGRQTLARLLR